MSRYDFSLPFPSKHCYSSILLSILFSLFSFMPNLSSHPRKFGLLYVKLKTIIKYVKLHLIQSVLPAISCQQAHTKRTWLELATWNGSCGFSIKYVRMHHSATSWEKASEICIPDSPAKKPLLPIEWCPPPPPHLAATNGTELITWLWIQFNFLLGDFHILIDADTYQGSRARRGYPWTRAHNPRPVRTSLTRIFWNR
jgi:hypothetical protein